MKKNAGGTLLSLAFALASSGCQQSFEEFDCADISDEELHEYVKAPYTYPERDWHGNSERYYEEGCVSSTDELWQRLDNASWRRNHPGEAFASLAPHHYEVSVEDDVDVRVLRCDYFDGTTLAGAPFHNTDALIELIREDQYWRRTSRTSTDWDYQSIRPAIVAYRSQCTDELCRVKVCEASYHYDISDPVRLYALEAEITRDGHVTFGPERFVRQIPKYADGDPAGMPHVFLALASGPI